MKKTKIAVETETDKPLYIQDEAEVVKALQDGHRVMRYEFGDSMHPIFKSGEYALLIPKKQLKRHIRQGDAIFCKLGEWYITHMVWQYSNGYYLIGSSLGNLNGWVHENQVYALARPTGKIKKER